MITKRKILNRRNGLNKKKAWKPENELMCSTNQEFWTHEEGERMQGRLEKSVGLRLGRAGSCESLDSF